MHTAGSLCAPRSGGPSGVDGGNANNYPLRAGKKTEFEGGVRINAFLAGGFLPAAIRGQRRSGYVHVCDWYATLLPLAGADPADNHPGLPPVRATMHATPMISSDITTRAL